MTKNAFADALRAGRHPLQALVSSTFPLTAEIVARSGFDGVWVDLQHGPLIASDFYPLIGLLSMCGVTVTVRVPTNDPSIIRAVLDAGAYVVICPDVQTAEQARAFANACRYPPAGTRGYGPSRAQFPWVNAPGSTPFSTEAENEAVMAIVQIESPQGLANVREILAVPGVDGVFPGMADYALAASGRALAGLSFLDPSVREPLCTIIDSTHAAGKTVGMPTASVAEVAEMLDLGGDWLLVGGDLPWVMAGAREAISKHREAVGRWMDGKTTGRSGA